MALAPALHHSRDVGPVTYNALRSQKTAWAEATYDALPSQKTSVAGDTEFFSLYEEELGGTRPDRLYEGLPWCRSSTTRSSCRRLMFLCRRWRTNCWRYADSSTLLSPSKLSKCPRSSLPVILASAVCVSRSRRRNSWWKCRRSFPTLRCTGFWSRTWTFLFLMVVVVSVVDVFCSSTRRLSWTGSSRMQLAVCGCSSLVVGGNFWARNQKSGGLGNGWDGPSVMRQPTDAIGSISCPLCSRCSHVESGTLFPFPCIWQSLFRASGCCL